MGRRPGDGEREDVDRESGGRSSARYGDTIRWRSAVALMAARVTRMP